MIQPNSTSRPTPVLVVRRSSETNPQSEPPLQESPQTPWLIRAIGSFLGSIARFLMGSTVLTMGAWYFFGVSHITASLDGKPIKASVKIDGRVVGKTPYETRFWPGEYTIEVQEPKATLSGLQYNQWELWTFFLGKDMEAEFYTE